ncbi:6-hydroxymethylpterin diphosphokinase MptE-like protein [Bacteroides cellulosilyticus]|uniref:6-hydroxymethylpterin diphosphokinase MptE-like protein n=1 Tax=Bacteroides cellulosilyticus TaxID=246787 RepID=UPI0032C16584
MQKKQLKRRFWKWLIRLMWPHCYIEWFRWAKLRGRYRGKRIFLIANGPSLNVTPLFLLKDEYTIVFNRFTLMLERLNFIPSFYMIIDALVASTAKDDIYYFINKAKYIFIPDVANGNYMNFRKIFPQNDKVMYMFEWPNLRVRFSNHLPYVSRGSTVVYSAFQVLKYMGFSEVVVVGNDMDYVIHTTANVLKEESIGNGKKNISVKSMQDDDPNHFDPRYFGKDKEYHQPTETIVQNIFADLDCVAKEYSKSGVKVVNAGYNSKVRSFERQDFYECLGYSQEKIDKLFNDLVKSLGWESAATLLTQATKADGIWEGELEVVCIPTAKAVDVVKKKVLDYLPIGPYCGCLYFINRKLIKKQ